MKRKAKSAGRNHQSGKGGRHDQRIRHGLNSKAVKLYRKLDRDFRNTEQPDADMIKGLGSALLEALNTVSTDTDINDPHAVEGYAEFITVDCLSSLRGIRETVVRKLRTENVED